MMENKVNNLSEITKEKMIGFMNELAKKRPAFHNEQDFQFELAWLLRSRVDNNIKIRLEYRYYDEENKKRAYIDIFLFDNKRNEAIAIELKYKTRNSKKDGEYYKFGLEYQSEKEEFQFTNHAAQDEGAFFYLSDVKRIESEVEKGVNNYKVIRGFAILLTNDKKYYETGFKEEHFYRDFDISGNQGVVKIKSGIKKISIDSAFEKKELRELEFNKEYKSEWMLYENKGWKSKEVDNIKKLMDFHMLIMEINP